MKAGRDGGLSRVALQARFTDCDAFAVVSGRDIKVHRRRLNAAFGLHWQRASAHTALRYILQGLDPQAVELVFRRHAAALHDTAADPSRRSIALDGKTLRRSFDNFNDRKAAQVLHAFDVEAGLILAHVDIEAKTNEIPAAQQLLGELKVAHSIITPDAMHCQKTLEAAAQAQARVIIQLKDNQSSRLQNVEAVCASRNPTNSDTEVTTGRGRHETRTAEIFRANTAVSGTEWKPLIKVIVRAFDRAGLEHPIVAECFACGTEQRQQHHRERIDQP